MRIFIVRHAQTIANKNKIIQGQEDTPITPEGIQNTYRTALYLRSKNIAKIFASPLGRTVQTSQIIADAVQINKSKITYLDGLKEIDLKPWALAKISSIDNSDDVSSYKTYMNSPLLFKALSGENLLDVQIRVKESFKQIINQCNNDDNIVVVSHSVAIRTFLLSIDGYGFDHIWEYKIHPSSVTEILYQNLVFYTVTVGMLPNESNLDIC